MFGDAPEGRAGGRQLHPEDVAGHHYEPDKWADDPVLEHESDRDRRDNDQACITPFPRGGTR